MHRALILNHPNENREAAQDNKKPLNMETKLSPQKVQQQQTTFTKFHNDKKYSDCCEQIPNYTYSTLIEQVFGEAITRTRRTNIASTETDETWR